MMPLNKKLLLATRNRHKQTELQEMLKSLQIKVITLNELSGLHEVEESGCSFEENAVKKAREYAILSGMVCLADDSGLVVDALGGQPGIYSARFAGAYASDEQNNAKLLQMLEKVKGDDRTARFKCVIAVCDTALNIKTVKGTCEGKIAFEPAGNSGFGYDPLFIPQGYSISFSEITFEEKNRISHRGKALRNALPIIEAIMSGSKTASRGGPFEDRGCR